MVRNSLRCGHCHWTWDQSDPRSNRLGWNYPKSNSPIGPGISGPESNKPQAASFKLDKKELKDYIGKMDTKKALKIIGGSLSKPSKMPGWSIGLPAKECKTGGKLQAPSSKLDKKTI